MLQFVDLLKPIEVNNLITNTAQSRCLNRIRTDQHPQAGCRKQKRFTSDGTGNITQDQVFPKIPQLASHFTSQFDEGRDNTLIKTHTYQPLHHGSLTFSRTKVTYKKSVILKAPQLLYFLLQSTEI